MTSSPKTWGDQLQIGVIKNLTIERRPQQQPPPGALISQKLFKLSPLLHHLECTFSWEFGLVVWKKNSKEKEVKKCKERNRQKQ
jgi:hypothetical protein